MQNFVCSCGEKYHSDEGRIACERSHVRRGSRKKPKLSWGPPPKERFSQGRRLMLNGKLVGKFFGHEEDGSVGSIDEVLTALEKAGVIEYDSPWSSESEK